MADASHVTWLPSGHVERADLAVLIVSWNVKELLLKNLESLEASQGTITTEIIVIDNASSDGTVESVRARFPSVRVIANKTNAGFSRANFQGMLAMHARHCLLLNPDMRVAPDALQKTVEYLNAHPDVAVLGGKLLSPDGSVIRHVRRFPDIRSQLIILLKLPHLFPNLLNHYLADDLDYEREQPIDSIRGSYFAVSRGALEALGGLDTRYFLWMEEVDYCKTAATHGWKVMYTPMIQATDLVGKSFSQRKIYWKQKMFTRSMLEYFQKWHPWWQSMLITLVRPLALAAAWVADCF